MTYLLDKLAVGMGSVQDKPFQPIARYHREMDFLIYLREDCSYRADRVDAFLTLLWHPNERRLVGIKLKGFRFIFEQLREIIGDDEPEAWRLESFLKFLRFALLSGLAEAMMEDWEATREKHLRERYDEAIRFAEAATVPREELPFAKAA